MSAIVSFERVSMGWNAIDVKPFYFDNTMTVSENESLEHLVAWTATVARGAPGSKLKALVINSHGVLAYDYKSTLDSGGGIPRISGGYGLKIGNGIIGPNNAGSLFKTLEGLVKEIHLYGCSAGDSYTPLETGIPSPLGEFIANASKAIVVASDSFQPDVEGPGLNMAPSMVGRVIRFTPAN